MKWETVVAGNQLLAEKKYQKADEKILSLLNN